jgi:hypothetical protein
MSNILFEAHSGWRYIVILVAIAAFVKLLVGLLTNSKWGALDQRLAASFPMVMDIQLLLGLILWIVRQQWTIALPTRTWEHPVTMILAIVVAHVGWSRVKKSNESANKFRTGVIYDAISGLLLAIGVMRITEWM